ncbi:MAG: DUF2520 domain-containing protein [Pyrinomonadaceae bacterium]|nr:DUF2520 domain-containing protein [Pyrinomonadaceae bacterium]
MVTVSIVGIGRVGGALDLALRAAKYDVQNLIGKEPTGRITTVDMAGTIESDVVLITTQDSEISDAAASIEPLVAGSPVVLHTSGALPSSILSPLRERGCAVGSMHPLVSISRPELGPERFRGAYFCVEGDEAAVKMARKIAEDLGGRPFAIDTRFKTLYHAAAVTACGHFVALFDAAVEMMTKCGLSADQSKEILFPLLFSTVQNLGEQSTEAALTGTFARADIETFTRHLGALNEVGDDDLLEIYLLLGERSLELAAKQGVSADRIESLRTKVAVAKSKLKW